jgi:hypothetical protein
VPFETPLSVTPEGDRMWRLVEPLRYRGAVDEWTIPTGYATDFASVPRVASWLIPTYGRWTRAAVVHDYLITHELPAGRISSIDVDGVFRRILRELGVSTPRRWLMWAGVRWGALFGGRAAGWWRTALPTLAISFPALPVLALGGIPVLVASLPLAVAELLFPGRPQPEPRHPARHDAVMTAIAHEVERRTTETFEREVLGDLDGWQPTGILPALGSPEIARIRDLAAGRPPVGDDVAPSATTQRRARLALDDYERESARADAERITGRPTQWDGDVLRYRDGTPVPMQRIADAIADERRAKGDT